MPTNSMNRVIQCLRRAALCQNESEPSDGQLLEWFIERRDEVAFEILLRRHGPMVLGVCRRVLNAHDAEDAFQATFAVLVRKATSVLPRQMVGNWLYGVAYQTATRARAQAAKRRVKERQAAMPETKVAPEDLWHDLLPLLDQELSRLPAKYRFPIVLCDLEGKTYKEAARQLDCPEGTLSARLARARRMLAKRLTRRGMAVSGTTLSSLLSPKVASACLPPSLVATTLKVTSLAAGKAASAGAISAKVATLTEGVLKTMLLTKLKIATAILLAVMLTVTTAGLLAFQNQTLGTPTASSKNSNAPIRKPVEKSTYLVKVPSQLEGVILFVGTEIEEGEKVPPERLLTVQVGGEKKRFRRLKKGDHVKEGQLLAQLDDAFARTDLAIKEARVKASKADLSGAEAIAQEALNNFKQAEEAFYGRLGRNNSVVEYRNASLTKDKCRFDAAGKRELTKLAELESQGVQTLIELHEIRSRVNGIIAAIHKHTGEAVRKWETVLEIEVAAEPPADSKQDGTAQATRNVVKATHLVKVPSLLDGVIVSIGTEIKEGEKVPADRLVTVQVGGKKREFRRLKKGDTVIEGQLLARLDDRLTRAESAVEIKEAKAIASQGQRAF
jgi:RNA polymerase sigma factor (sigma-70 family)